MTVFKTYFKVLKSYTGLILMYFGIFMLVSILVGSIGSSSTTFSASKPKVIIINNDNSIVTNGFIEFVKDNAQVIDKKMTSDEINDALFYRAVDFIIDIPSNYGNNFINDESVKINTTSVPNSLASTYSEMLFNRYFNTYKTYLKSGISEDKILSLVIKDLKINTKVQLLDNSKKDIEKLNYFYNYTNYTILATCILVIGIITNSFTSSNIKKRNESSSTSYKVINSQLFSGHLFLTLGIWLAYVIVSFIMYSQTMFSINGLLYILNSLLFSIMALSLGFLVGNLVKNREAQSGIVNIIALGSSFLCGAFVPQEMLGKGLLNITQVLPSYWYIKINNDIALLSNYDWPNIITILVHMTIIIVFTVIFFLLTNVVTKKMQNK